MKLLLLMMFALPSYAGVVGTTEKGQPIFIDTICIEGIKYYKVKEASFMTGKRGFGYMSVAFDAKTLKPATCKHVEIKK